MTRPSVRKTALFIGQIGHQRNGVPLKVGNFKGNGLTKPISGI